MYPYAPRKARAARATPFALLISERRQHLGLRLIDVAAACNATEMTIWTWETGRHWPRYLTVAAKLADVLGLTLDQVWRAVAAEIKD